MLKTMLHKKKRKQNNFSKPNENRWQSSSKWTVFLVSQTVSQQQVQKKKFQWIEKKCWKSKYPDLI